VKLFQGLEGLSPSSRGRESLLEASIAGEMDDLADLPSIHSLSGEWPAGEDPLAAVVRETVEAVQVRRSNYFLSRA
jgi:hypothetical protein